jgi:hypothetical protein
VTRQPRAFFALDHGSATTSASLVGHAGGRWRLLAHAAAPASTDLDALLAGVLAGVGRTDPELLAFVSAQDDPSPAALVEDLARLESRSPRPRRIAVLASSRRQRHRLEELAARSGWLVTGGSADAEDALAMSRLVLSPSTHAVLLGADSTPSGDEKRHLPMLAALAAAAARRRPELAVVLAGGAASTEDEFRGTGEHDRMSEAADGKAGGASTESDAREVAAAAGAAAGEAAGESNGEIPSGADDTRDSVLLAPDAEAGSPAGSALQQVLEGLRASQTESRLSFERSIRSLALLMDKSIEALEVGLNGGLRCRAEPFGPGHGTIVASHVEMAAASFAPDDLSDEMIDQVLSWSTVAFDRSRLNDRLRDMRVSPWGEAAGEGALLRLAAAKAAVERLVAATPEISAQEMPEVLVAGGGIWASSPPSVVALAMADLVRRSGISQLACDQARLLGPLGVISDDDERAMMLRDLLEDVLLPLGSLVLPAGIRQGRSAGRMRVMGPGATSDIDLQPGGIWAIELPPGQKARAEMDFRDAVRLGARGHRFSFDVTGGLGGLFVDLRDIPLRLPDRADQKRATWESWQRAMWAEIDE